MNFINKNSIVNFFHLINESKIDYILIRNISNELPDFLEEGKDIDLLINNKDQEKVHFFLQKNRFKKIPHPHRNNVFLYGVNKFNFYKNTDKVILDLNYQLACRSTDAGQWIPLDQIIQQSAWRNKQFISINKDFGYWALSFEDEFITLITRSVFDKNEFNQPYVKRIQELYQLININDVALKLELIFFKFTPYLLDLIAQDKYDVIINDYLTFKEY